MATVKIDIPIQNLADMIAQLKENELETLTLLLSKQSNELLQRKKDFENGNIKPLTTEEVFDV